MAISRIMETMEYGPNREADDAVREWLAERQGRFGLFIGGRWHRPDDAETLPSVNPADGETIAHIVQARPQDVHDAATAARAAAAEWAARSGYERARFLHALASAIQKKARLLSVLETLDNGKPIRETRDFDIPLAARYFDYYAGWAHILADEFPGCKPIGVAGHVLPWHFPLLMLAAHAAPALAAGCTVVIKPDQHTSLTALAFAELCEEIDLPPGVINVVTGDDRVSELIATHPDIDKVSFAGPTEAGRRIRTHTAGSGKQLTLQLSGKSPIIVFDDADIDSAVEGVVDSVWSNQGEMSWAGSRLLVQESIEETFVAKLRSRMETLRIGDPLDRNTDIGAIVGKAQLERLEQLVAEGLDEGATMWQPVWEKPAGGFFFPPTLLTDVAPAMTVAQVDLCGPVLVTMTFRTAAEAVELANNTTYGFAASIWTENVNVALDVAEKVKAGVVWVNGANALDAAGALGGYKESGFGKIGGREALHDYLQPAWQSEAAPAVNAADATGSGGRAGDGSRIHSAVTAARKATSWGRVATRKRAQMLRSIADNMARRRNELARRLAASGVSEDAALAEVNASVERLSYYAAWADNYEGAVGRTLDRHVTMTVPEPLGVVGIGCPDEHPLLAFVSLVAPAIAMGNAVVVIPSPRWPFTPLDVEAMFHASGVPAGVINVVTGARDELVRVLAEHDDVDAVWYFGTAEGSAAVEQASAGNLKRTWVNYGRSRDWFDAGQGAGREFLRHATQTKTIWIPYGA